MNIKNLAGAFIFALSLVGTACTQQQPAHEESHTTSTKITDKAYICPMYCENSASDQPGKCPVCGMDLEKNPDYTGTYSAPVSASADTTQPGIAEDTLQQK